MKMLLRGITVVDPAAAGAAAEDVLIADGKIVARATNLTLPEGAREIDARGDYLVPGLCDLRVTVGEPGNEQRETLLAAQTAAANGGVTAFLCMPDCDPALDSPAAVHYLRSLAQLPVVDVHASARLTRAGDDTTLAPMLELLQSGVQVFGNGAGPLKDAEMLRRAMAYVGPSGAVVSDLPLEASLAQGAQMNAGPVADELGLPSSPAVAEKLGAARLLWLAQQTGAQVHIPAVGCRATLDFLRSERGGGAQFSAACNLLNLILTDEKLRSFNTWFKQHPPLRSADDAAALLDALAKGAIDCVASNHRACALHEKDVEFEVAEAGSRNLELLAPILWSLAVAAGKISPQRFVELVSTNPRKIMGLPPISLSAGSAANCAVISVNPGILTALPAPQSDFALDPAWLKARVRYTINASHVWDCAASAMMD